jgi:FMN-dependent NADH-azoreductase
MLFLDCIAVQPESHKQMKILHVSCSPRGQASESYRLAQEIIGHLRQGSPASTLITRDLGGGTLAHVDANYALAQHSATAEVPQSGSISKSEELIQELDSADVVVIGTPMHNLSVPSVLKAWIDHVVRARRSFNVTTQGKVGTLRDRPVYVAVASGGRFSGEHARQPDFLTPYLKLILGTIGLRDLTFFSVEGTGSHPDAVAEARAGTDRALQEHFYALALDRPPTHALLHCREL